jgi:hypothetical protein
VKTFRLPRVNFYSTFFTPQFPGNHLTTLFPASREDGGNEGRANPRHGLRFLRLFFLSARLTQGALLNG